MNDKTDAKVTERIAALEAQVAELRGALEKVIVQCGDERSAWSHGNSLAIVEVTVRSFEKIARKALKGGEK